MKTLDIERIRQTGVTPEAIQRRILELEDKILGKPSTEAERIRLESLKHLYRMLTIDEGQD